MSSSASSVTWLPIVLPRAVATPAPARPGGRHLAPEAPGVVRLAAPGDLTRSGRHVESEWGRDLHDPRRDEVDALDWLGFSQD